MWSTYNPDSVPELQQLGTALSDKQTQDELLTLALQYGNNRHSRAPPRLLASRFFQQSRHSRAEGSHLPSTLAAGGETAGVVILSLS